MADLGFKPPCTVWACSPTHIVMKIWIMVSVFAQGKVVYAAGKARATSVISSSLAAAYKVEPSIATSGVVGLACLFNQNSALTSFMFTLFLLVTTGSSH